MTIRETVEKIHKLRQNVQNTFQEQKCLFCEQEERDDNPLRHVSTFNTCRKNADSTTIIQDHLQKDQRSYITYHVFGKSVQKTYKRTPYNSQGHLIMKAKNSQYSVPWKQLLMAF